MGGQIITEIADKLKNSDDVVTNPELLDYIIAFQLTKIQNYHAKVSYPPKNMISEKTENAMSNLIELLKLREHYKHYNK